ncbi:MAG: SusC/RagA family TonB-linked outer membrane protein [Bacteroidota bacterium]
MNRVKTLFWAFVLSATCTIVHAQNISGTVTDESGQPLIGASILVKSTSTGTVTDLDGKYSVSVPNGAEVLVFSYTGYTTQEVDIVSGQTVYDVTLEEGILATEVVVTGTGIATDRRRTAISVESIDGEDLPQVSSGSVDQALVGKIPGAYIQQSSGQPGQQANIILRGINSLGTSNPMIMIDGVQISTDNTFNGSTRNVSSRLADIDFNNVERVEVIQGAAAGTIYGAQGANGVIQIFTKKGRAGKPRISLNSAYGIGTPLLGNFDYAERHAFITTSDGRLSAGGTEEALGRDEFGVWGAPVFESGSDVLTDNEYVEPIFNLADQVFKDDVLNYRSSLSISGGSEALTYSVTGTFNSQESAIRGQNDRFNFGSRLGFEIFNSVDVNIGLSVIRGNNNTGAITGTDNVFSALGSVATTFPFIDFTFENADGNLVANPTGDNSVNPLYTETFRQRSTRLTRVIPNINLNWGVNEWLTLDYKYGFDYYRDDYNEIIANQIGILGTSSQGGIDPNVGRTEQRLREGTLQNSIASAFLKFGDENNFLSNTQLAFDWRQREFSNVFAQGTGLPPFPLTTLRAAEQSNIDEFDDVFVTYGALINTKLEYQRKIGVSAGVRADYSSAFGEGSDPFVFPRGDVYVRLSEFSFWDGLKNSFPEFKFRAAYGEAGIQPGAFDRIRTLTAGQLGTGGFLAPQLAQTNPLLDVQVSQEFEVGIDASITPGGRSGGLFSFFKLGLTYWDRTSEDVIRDIDVAPTTGAATILDNAITLESSGWQISLQKSIVDNPGFTWNWTTNFGRQETVLADNITGADIPVDDNFILREGELLGTFRGVQALTSLDQTREDGTPYLENTDGFEVVPESGFVVNTETKQVVFTDDVVVIGNGLPDFNMSFIHNFTIGQSLRFGFQLDWVQGFDIYNQTRQWGYRDNLHGDVDDPVTIGGETGAFFDYYRSIYNTNQANSAFVEDGSFLRLRNAHIAFDIADVLTINGVNKLELEISGFNLFTITDYSGFDPEAAADLNDPTRIGLDQYAFPNSRIVQFGLNVGF